MNILGVGPSELLFIVVIALIILGPKDMQKTGRRVGHWLRRVTTSDGWKLFQQTSTEIQTLPNRLMREAALDELNEVQGELSRPIGFVDAIEGGPVQPQVSPTGPDAKHA